MNRASRWMVSLCLAIPIGCGGAVPEDDGPIPMGKLPAPVVKAAQKSLPDVAFDAATKETIGKQKAFGLSGKDKKGKTHEIKVSRDGKVLDTK